MLTFMPHQIYIETTVVSYFTARRNRDLIRAAHQLITQEWWQSKRSQYELFVSDLVLEEITRGDAKAAKDREEAIKDIAVLRLNNEAHELAQQLLHETSLPAKAAADALHVAIAIANGMDVLLTWNCRHIANLTTRVSIEEFCRSNGYNVLLICTPEQMME